MNIYNDNNQLNNRRILRKKMTPAEITLWSLLRRRKLDNFKFYRQYGIGSYVVDFYCPERRLVVELDGNVHFDEYQIERDKERTRYLQSHNVRVLRFENFEVFKYPERTISEIRKFLLNDIEPENLLIV